MELTTAIMGRRSIRKYLDKEVPGELLEEIVQEALWAPSGMNRQPWKIFIYTKNEKDKLLQAFTATEKHIRPRLEQVFPEKMVNISLQAIKTAGGAPVVLLFYTPTTELLMRTSNMNRAEAGNEHYASVLSVAALIQNLLLSAYSRGLGTCWMTAQKYVEKEISEVVGIEEHELISIVALGYPDQSPPAPPRKQDVVKWLGF